MPQGTRPDWVAIRTEYESGVPRREICEKYGVQYQNLNSKIKRGNWTASREKVGLKVDQERTKKLVQKKADKAVAKTKRIDDLHERWLGLFEHRTSEMEETGRVNVLEIQRMADVTTTIEESSITTKQDTKADQLVFAILNSNGEMQDADIPS